MVDFRLSTSDHILHKFSTILRHQALRHDADLRKGWMQVPTKFLLVLLEVGCLSFSETSYLAQGLDTGLSRTKK